MPHMLACNPCLLTYKSHDQPADIPYPYTVQGIEVRKSSDSMFLPQKCMYPQLDMYLHGKTSQHWVPRRWDWMMISLTRINVDFVCQSHCPTWGGIARSIITLHKRSSTVRWPDNGTRYHCHIRDNIGPTGCSNIHTETQKSMRKST